MASARLPHSLTAGYEIETILPMSTPLFRSGLSIAVAMAAFFLAAPSSIVRAESLLDPKSWTELSDWAMAGKVVGHPTKKEWKSIEPGDKLLYNGKAGKTGNLISKAEYGDVEVKVQFMIPKGSNSGIYFQNRYEIQILDSYGKADEALKHGDCGGIYERWDDEKEGKHKGFEGTPPRTNATTAPGTWQEFHIIFRAPRFAEDGKKTENARFVRVVHNGVTIHENAEVTGPTRGGAAGPELASAPFKIQGDHGPVAFRKFEVKPLELD